MKKLLFLAACAALAGCSAATGRLLSDDPRARAEAAEAAAAAGPREKKDIVRALKRVLADSDSGDRAYAAAALEDLGPAAADAVPELIAALGGADQSVSAPAGRALSKLTEAAPALAAALSAESPELRAQLGRILAAQGEPGAKALAKNFERGDKQLALRSSQVLEEMGPAAEKAVPVLARAAASSDAEVQAAAAAALSGIGRPAGLWLADALRSPNPRSRAGASLVLGAMLRPPAEALEALAGALEDQDAAIRLHSAMALAAYTPEVLAALPENFIPALSKAAAGGEAAEWARRALLKTGRADGSWLADALKARDPLSREAAAASLAGLKQPPAQAVRPLLLALADGEAAVRRAAAAALGNYAFRTPKALPRNAPAVIAIALGDKDPQVRVAAAEALGALGPAAAAAEPELWEVFKSADCRQRAAAAKALGAIKPRLLKNRAIVRALQKPCPAKPVLDPALPGLGLSVPPAPQTAAP
ncbi:MAG TPA: hypothetical protein DEQ38_08235 [Elusimicrobia bacterium]|nr:MAG: hypothetical protein A2089_03150 [Elusimicrobia bacterium GWD2_63_28]HCC48084.1 hypothetical protein [Elusimicrobiota bacterium]